MRGNFSLVARYSLKFTRFSLLVIKSLVTCCKIRPLLVAEVARCKQSLVTCSKTHSLLVAEVARCKKSLVTDCTANFDRYLLCKAANKNQFQLNLVMDDKI